MSFMLKMILPSQSFKLCSYVAKPLSINTTSLFFSGTNLINEKPKISTRSWSIRSLSSKNFNSSNAQFGYNTFVVSKSGLLCGKKSTMDGFRPLVAKSFNTNFFFYSIIGLNFSYACTKKFGRACYAKASAKSLDTTFRSCEVSQIHEQGQFFCKRSIGLARPFTNNVFALAAFEQQKTIFSVKCRSFSYFSKYFEKKESFFQNIEGYKLQKQSTKYQIPIRNACKLFILYVCGSFCWLYLITYSKKDVFNGQKFNFLFQEVVFKNLPLFQKSNLSFTKETIDNIKFKDIEKTNFIKDKTSFINLEREGTSVNLQLSESFHDFSAQNYIGLGSEPKGLQAQGPTTKNRGSFRDKKGQHNEKEDPFLAQKLVDSAFSPLDPKPRPWPFGPLGTKRPNNFEPSSFLQLSPSRFAEQGESNVDSLYCSPSRSEPTSKASQKSIISNSILAHISPKVFTEVKMSNLLKKRFIFFNKKTYSDNLYYSERNYSTSNSTAKESNRFFKENNYATIQSVTQQGSKLAFFARKPLFLSLNLDGDYSQKKRMPFLSRVLEGFGFSGASVAPLLSGPSSWSHVLGLGPKARGPFLLRKTKKGLESLTLAEQGVTFWAKKGQAKVYQKQILSQKEQYIFSGTSLTLNPDLDFIPKQLEHINKAKNPFSNYSPNFLPKLELTERLKWCNYLNSIVTNNYLYTNYNYNYIFNLSLGDILNFSKNVEKKVFFNLKNPTIATSLYSGLRKRDVQLVRSCVAPVSRNLSFSPSGLTKYEPKNQDSYKNLEKIFKLLRSTTKTEKSMFASGLGCGPSGQGRSPVGTEESHDPLLLRKTKNIAEQGPKGVKTIHAFGSVPLKTKEKPLKKKNVEKTEGYDPSGPYFPYEPRQGPLLTSLDSSSNDAGFDSLTQQKILKDQNLWFLKDDCKNHTIRSKVGFLSSTNCTQSSNEKSEALSKPIEELGTQNQQRLLNQPKLNPNGLLEEGKIKKNQKESSCYNAKQVEILEPLVPLINFQKFKPENFLRRFFFEKKKVISKLQYFNNFFIDSRLQSGFIFPDKSIINKNENKWKKGIPLKIKKDSIFLSLNYVIPTASISSLPKLDKWKPLKERDGKEKDNFLQSKTFTNPKSQTLFKTSFITLLFEINPLQESISYKQTSQLPEQVATKTKDSTTLKGFIQLKKNQNITEFFTNSSTNHFKELWNFTGDTSVLALPPSGPQGEGFLGQKLYKSSTFFRKNQGSASFVTLDKNADIKIKNCGLQDKNWAKKSTVIQIKNNNHGLKNKNAPESFFGAPYLQLGERFTIEKLKSNSQIGLFYSVHSGNSFNNLAKPAFPYASTGTSLKTIFGKKLLKQQPSKKGFTQNLVTNARLVSNWSIMHFPKNKFSWLNSPDLATQGPLALPFGPRAWSCEAKKLVGPLAHGTFVASPKGPKAQENSLFSTFTKNLFFDKKENHDNFLQHNLLHFKRIAGKANGHIINSFKYYNPGTKRERNIEDTMLTLEGYKKSRLFPKVKVNYQGISVKALPINEKLYNTYANQDIDLQSILGGMRQRTELERKADSFIQARASQKKENQNQYTTQSPSDQAVPLDSRANKRVKPSKKKLRFTSCFPLRTLLSVSSQKNFSQTLKSNYLSRVPDISEYFFPALSNKLPNKYDSTATNIIKNSSETKGFYFEKLTNKNTLGIPLTQRSSNTQPKKLNYTSVANITGTLSKIIFFGTIWFSYKILASQLSHSTQFLPAVFTEAIGLQSFQKKFRIITPKKTNQSFKNLAGAEKTLAELRDLIWTFGLVGTGGPRGEHSYLASFSYLGSGANGLAKHGPNGGVIAQGAAKKGQQRRNSIFSKDRNRFLLVGPPGTGKTLLVKTLAKEANVPIIVQPVSQLRMITGVENPISTLFHVARQIKPCIIFLDELDTLGTDINSSNNTLTAEQKGSNAQWASLARKYTYTLLLELDGLTSSTRDLLIIGATNRPETLNPALTRAGRFETIINCNLPSQKQRFSVLSLYLSLLKKRESNKTKINRVRSSTLHNTWAVEHGQNPGLRYEHAITPLDFNKQEAKEVTPLDFMTKAVRKKAQKLSFTYNKMSSIWKPMFRKIRDLKDFRSPRSGLLLSFSAKTDTINILKEKNNFYVNYLAKKSYGLSQASLGTAVNESAMDSILNNYKIHTLKSLEQAIESVKTLTYQPTNYSNLVNPFIPATNFNSLWNSVTYTQNSNKVKVGISDNKQYSLGSSDSLIYSKNNYNVKIWPFLVYMSYQTTGSLIVFFKSEKLSVFSTNLAVSQKVIKQKTVFKNELLLSNKFPKKQKTLLIQSINNNSINRNKLLARRALIRNNIISKKFFIKNNTILCYEKDLNRFTWDKGPLGSKGTTPETPSLVEHKRCGPLGQNQQLQQKKALQTKKNVNYQQFFNPISPIFDKTNFFLSLYRRYAGSASTNLYSSIRPQNLKLSSRFGLYKNPTAVATNLLILNYLTIFSNSIKGGKNVSFSILKNNTYFSISKDSLKISPKFMSQNAFYKVNNQNLGNINNPDILRSTCSARAAAQFGAQGAERIEAKDFGITESGFTGLGSTAPSGSLDFAKTSSQNHESVSKPSSIEKKNKNSFRFQDELSRQIKLTKPLTTSWFRIYLSRPIFRYEIGEYIENREYYPQNNYNLICQSLHFANLSLLSHRNKTAKSVPSTSEFLQKRNKKIEEKVPWNIGLSKKELGEIPLEFTLYLAIVAYVFHKVSLFIGKNRELLDYCVYNNLRYGTLYDFSINQICKKF